ncbi:hypothetical protein EYF80_004549 [Liparis tanakae]|uniref:Uncharacterized protein n=1 Tax=Liparis tanakae TaxID=230148 RepID=A0A4Z2J4R8_9TELE|nr:hypothetical protein EYF80_004549 [Liparis tanakae]
MFPLAAQRPCIKASCRGLGSKEGEERYRKEEERIGDGEGRRGGEEGRRGGGGDVPAVFDSSQG